MKELKASSKIPHPQYFERLTKRDGRIRHIVNEIEAALREGVSQQLTAFAKDFPPTEKGLWKLWAWVKSNIQYVEDSEEAQVVQEPARLNVTRRGDCKSFSLFIASVLACNRTPFSLMYVHYSDTGSNHVYPIAHTPEGDIIVDAVWKHYNRQKEPYTIIRKQRYNI